MVTTVVIDSRTWWQAVAELRRVANEIQLGEIKGMDLKTTTKTVFQVSPDVTFEATVAKLGVQSSERGTT